MVENKNLLITAALVIVIMAAVVVMIYVNLPINDAADADDGESSDTDISDEEQSDDMVSNITLSVIYGEIEKTYNYTMLHDLGPISGDGHYIKTKLLPDTVIVGDVYTYTGVTFLSILQDIGELPENYIINVTASDEWVTEFSIDDVTGNVDIYNEDGTIDENGTATMILSYMEDGKYYSEIDQDNEIGPLRIAFIGDDAPITSSALWSKRVVSIEIIEQP
jgi:hypothetical protein